MHIHTTHTDSDEYSIVQVAFCKNATIDITMEVCGQLRNLGGGEAYNKRSLYPKHHQTGVQA